ncbi:MAG TPA: hypothetical protein VLT61_03080 [Anaeromyxobacteraceae bacterium]|nr:hypothetical protein [Anaeromyxobacteraceae bacterium]
MLSPLLEGEGAGVTRWRKLFAAAGLLAALGLAYWRFAIPKHRVAVRSELIMLGDLDGDRRWGEGDLEALEAILREPFRAPDAKVWKLDLNRNGLVDEEDAVILRSLVAAGGDPYAAEAAETAKGAFPRPRELYAYRSIAEYLPRPLWTLPYPQSRDSVLGWLKELVPPFKVSTYSGALDAAVFAEAVRLDEAYRLRAPTLSPSERVYAEGKLANAESLFRAGDRYELLLALMDLVEDAETLASPRGSDVTLQLLAFRDHLRDLLGSVAFAEFEAGRTDWREVLTLLAGYLEADLGLARHLEALGPARSLTSLENYLDRAEWQYYKTSSSSGDLEALVAFAQHDPRYLRAVARTSRRLQDPGVRNHNLPMVLLFREALRIVGGDKKKAVGLLDESIRIPYAWISSIPREALPGSVALDNFLLPGNMEDGADKSRHWNVFGGICLYKSPQEALDLALRREMQDLRDDGYSPKAMREFLRDMIANLNGMYHVMTVNPALLGPVARPPGGTGP